MKTVKRFNKKLWEKIRAINLEQTYLRLVHRKGMTPAVAQASIERYLRYLYCSASRKFGPISPDKLTDEVWHDHILDMEKYEADCMKAFGYVLKHRPTYIDPLKPFPVSSEQECEPVVQCGGVCMSSHAESKPLTLLSGDCKTECTSDMIDDCTANPKVQNLLESCTGNACSGSTCDDGYCSGGLPKAKKSKKLLVTTEEVCSGDCCDNPCTSGNGTTGEALKFIDAVKTIKFPEN
jgi:hypothetical protein